MPRKLPILLTLALGLTRAASAEPVRLANGAVVPGDAVKATAEGLEVASPRGPQTLPWEQLSAGTRYRHQPGFRDAFPRVLAGEAVEIVAAPAPPPAATPSAPAPAPAPNPTPTRPAPTPPGGSSFTPVAATPQPAPRPATPAASRIFPEGTFKSAGLSLVTAIAFSSEAADVVYLGANIPEERNARPEELVVWWPNRAPVAPPQIVKQVGAGVFPPIRWTGVREGHDIEVELTPTLRMNHGRLQVQAQAYVTARKGSARARYFLRHTEIKWAADNKPLMTTPVFDAPAVRARFTDGGRRMIAMVKVGDWDILPLQGTETNLSVEAFDTKGRSVEKARVKTDEATLKTKSEAWEHEFKRLKAGESYVIKGALPLGPVFGEAKFEQAVDVVDLKL